jgi:sigma-B regulation protein RsbU (phosphoserine phosphatase)
VKEKINENNKKGSPTTARQADPCKRLKVLTAEEDLVGPKGLTNFLSQWGYQPVEAGAGDDAWRLLEEAHEVPPAVLDWDLAGLSGIQICQQLRVRPAGTYVYAILISARNSTEKQGLALGDGADDYLPKPAKPSMLRARLSAGRRIIETAFGQISPPASSV